MACITPVRACRLTKPKTGSTQNLTLGTCASLSTDVYVYGENTQGSIYRFETTTDGSGTITFDMASADFFTGDNDYKIWATLQTDDINTPLTVSVVGGSYNAIKVKFVRVYDNAGNIVGDSSQNVVLETASTAPTLGGDFFTFTGYKGIGNTASVAQNEDWKWEVTPEGNLGAYYREDGNWDLKFTINKV